jgi:SAM-dependent methyltransferase
MPEDHFDEHVAQRYDEDVAEMFDAAQIEPAVDFLAGLAGSGPALELGIGTGRIALALVRRGVPVHGVDLSPAMLARLRAKPGGAEIPTVRGDFASTSMGATFTLAYLVFNTIMNLTTAEAQVTCFQNVARHLEAEGRFVIEVSLPQLQRLPLGETSRVFAHGESHVGIDEYDVASQRLISHHYYMVDGRLEMRSVPFRYVWRRSSTSWRGSREWSCASGGPAGAGSRSPARAASTSRSGRRRLRSRGAAGRGATVTGSAAGRSMPQIV